MADATKDAYEEAFWKAESEVNGRIFSDNIRAGIRAVIRVERGGILQNIEVMRKSGMPAEGILSLIESRCKP